MQVQGSLSVLFRPGIDKNFRDSFQLFEKQYSQFLKVGNMDLPEIRATILTGFNRLVEIGDGEAITYDTLKMGNVVQGIDREFGLGYMVTKKTVEDDLYGKANQGAKYLAEAAQLTMEYRSAALLDDAFTGATFLGIDGLKLCSTAHTLINSTSTVANAPATNVGLSVTGVNALLDLAMTAKNENGDPIIVNPTKMIISNSSGELNKARQIWGSDLEPFTAENQKNPLKDRFPGLINNIIVSRYKSSAKSYFLVDEKLNDAWFLSKRPVTMEDSDDFDTGALKVKATTRFLIWFVDWRGWYGANPS